MHEDQIKGLMDRHHTGQDPYELHWLYNKLEVIKPNVIMEIGNWAGGNLYVFSHLLHKDTDILIGLDYEKRDYTWDPKKETCAQFHQIIRDSHSPKTKQVIEEILGDRKIDFLYIDGDHSESGTKQDYEMYSPLVRDGGMIGFHDLEDKGRGIGTSNAGAGGFWLKLDHPDKQYYFSNRDGRKGFGCGYIMKDKK